MEIPREKCQRLFRHLQRLDEVVADEESDMNDDRAYEEFLEIMFSCSEVQGEFEIMTIYEPNFVPFSKMESFYNNEEKDHLRSYYERMYNMHKVVNFMPYLERSLELLKKPPMEACPHMELVDWTVIMQRMVYLFANLDRAPP